MLFFVMDPFRLKKVADLRKRGTNPYAARFERTHTASEVPSINDGVAATIAGRVMLWRDMGKMTFGQVQDHTGKIQILLQEDRLGKEIYK